MSESRGLDPEHRRSFEVDIFARRLGNSRLYLIHVVSGVARVLSLLRCKPQTGNVQSAVFQVVFLAGILLRCDVLLDRCD
jgi:hypothetical protein